MTIKTILIIAIFVIVNLHLAPVGSVQAFDDHSQKPEVTGEAMLDALFGVNGTVVTSVVPGNDVAQAVAIQPDGKIVIGGWAFNGVDNDFAVVRYLPNGQLDADFDGSANGNGIVLTNVGSGFEEAYSLALQSDGKIVLAGQAFEGSRTDIAVVRYNNDGTLDTSFDGDGRKILPQLAGSSMARSVSVRADGRIVLAGNGFTGTDFDMVVAQLMPNGDLDPSFDGNTGVGNGIVTTAVGSGNEFGYGVVVQSDGKVVVAGYFVSGNNTDTVLLRYDDDGVLDTTFSQDGIAIHSFSPQADEALALALAPNGQIVIAGCIRNGMPNDFLIARFLDDGSVDPSFGMLGRTVVPFSGSADLSLGVAVQPNGKIVAVGFGSNGNDNDFAVARLNVDGSLDATFGTGGRAMTMVGNATDVANGLAIQSDGRIVVAGRTTGIATDMAVVRFESGFGSISGRILEPNGSGIRSARVLMIDAAGRSRTASASSFGYYSFDRVPIGGNYTITVVSRRYRFARYEINNLADHLTNIDLTGME